MRQIFHPPRWVKKTGAILGLSLIVAAAVIYHFDWAGAACILGCTGVGYALLVWCGLALV